jgi:cytochrome P450 family 3 subfamily A
VILSTAFGRSLDVQGGNGGKVYEDARDMFQSLSGKWAVPMRIVQFLLLSTPWIAPLLEPLLRMSGAFGSLPRVTEAAIKMVEMRRKEGDATSKKDLLQVMIDTKDEQNKKGLSTGEIVADAVGFMLAGYETTSVALIFATYLLATHPEVQEKVFNEIHDYFDDNPVCIYNI